MMLQTSIEGVWRIWYHDGPVKPMDDTFERALDGIGLTWNVLTPFYPPLAENPDEKCRTSWIIRFILLKPPPCRLPGGTTTSLPYLFLAGPGSNLHHQRCAQSLHQCSELIFDITI